MPPRSPALLVLVAAAWLGGGCDALSTRTPEPPAGASTFVQPDTPEIVLANLTAALAERSPSSYRRSLSPDLVFTPSREAAARFAFWDGWGAPEEETSFRTLVASAQPAAEFSLSLATTAPAQVTPDTWTLDTEYVLIVPHQRAEAPTRVQGRLQWTIARGSDNLWSLSEWTDEATNGPTWSNLKALFFQ
jgi:hypothetical protein